MTAAVVFVAPIVAGLIQAVTGFGAGIFMMIFFPMLFPILNASALSSSISLFVSGPQALRYRKYAKWKVALLPVIVYTIVSTVSIVLVPYLPTALLKKVFGVFMVILSIYFLTVSGKFKIEANALTGTICGALSGILGGLFGIGGPPMVIYFLAALDTKEEYSGTIQLFFFISGLYTCIVRVFKGIYTMDLIPYTLLGLLGILIGQHIGSKIMDRIDAATMKKLVYLFLGFAGLTNIF